MTSEVSQKRIKKKLTDTTSPSFSPPEGDRPDDLDDSTARTWVLGLDIGTTGISAVLLNRVTHALFPMYWHQVKPSTRPPLSLTEDEHASRWFRLPANVTCDRQGSLSSFTPSIHHALDPRELDRTHHALHRIKPYLALGIPYISAATQKWEPIVRWSAQTPIPLQWFQYAMQTLLATLTQSASAASRNGHASASTDSDSEQSLIVCRAVGLDDGQVQSALSSLSNIVVGCPGHWPDTYPINIRRLLFQTSLIANTTRVTVLPEAIALILSRLPCPDGHPLTLPDQAASQIVDQASLSGATLAISSGTTLTELSLVHVPSDLATLSRQDFYLHSLDYGGEALDQDIISHILLPIVNGEAGHPSPPENAEDASFYSNGFHLSFAEDDWETIAKTDWRCPPSGNPAIADRIRFQQTLHQSGAGHRLLTLAQALKIGLQYYEQCNLNVGERRFCIHRRDLGNQVLIPFVEMLKTSILHLLKDASTTESEIQQVICSGGTASFRIIALWLRKRFPNATIVQDSYGLKSQRNGKDSVPRSDEINQCSRVAYGLATLPLHSRIAEQTQYVDDYMLINTLLKILPNGVLSVSAIMRRLDDQGINSDRHYDRIMRLLNGYLPPDIRTGWQTDEWLMPLSRLMLTPESTTLFEQPNPQMYRLKHQAKVLMQLRLQAIEADLHQVRATMY